MSSTRIVCISDTHNLLDQVEVPDGDILLHTGDFTGHGTEQEVRAFAEAITRLPHANKIVIAGNHDFLFETEPERARDLLADVTYLEDSGAHVCGIEFWGSPWQPRFHDWAFNLDPGEALAEKWALIPESTEVLLTHGPPHGVLDRLASAGRIGCEDLTRALTRVRPKMHMFGHIHEDYGTVERDGTLYVNASTCNLRYRAVNEPIVIEWSEEGPRLIESRGE